MSKKDAKETAASKETKDTEKVKVGKEKESVQETASDAVSAKEDAKLKEELERITKELAGQKEVLLRTAAEYDNYRKRTEREKAAIYNDAVSDAVAKLLPVEDNLERALAQPDCSAEDMRKGVEMVQNQMLEALKKLGVEAMGNVGEAFNPELHNAVSHIEDETLEENVISAVFQKGYKIGDKIVRHAMVQVAN